MRRSVLILALAAVLSAAATRVAWAADMPVDLELVLAVDVSRSMDIDEQQLQRDGYVAVGVAEAPGQGAASFTSPDGIGTSLTGRTSSA